MALYKYTTKSGQFYGVRFRVVEADGVERHKNLRGFTTQRAARLRDTPEQILKTYGHLFPSRQRELNKKLDELFD